MATPTGSTRTAAATCASPGAACSRDDDAIVLKSSLALGVRRSTEDVVVTDCDLVHVRNGLKIGTESCGDFKHIVFRNCTMSGRPEMWNPLDLRPFPSAGVSLQNVDGGTLEQVVVTGIRMVNVRAPIFVRLGERGQGQTVPAAGTLARITISDIVATGAEWASSITGVPGHDVSDIALSDIRISGKGRGEAALVSRPGAGTGAGISRRRAIPQSSRPRPVLPARGGAARRADHAHGGRARCPAGPDPGRRAWGGDHDDGGNGAA